MSAEDCVGCRHINNCLGDCVGFLQTKPQTNFDRITKSPEALTSWLDEHVGAFCSEISCDECVANKECWHQGNDTDYSNGELWYAWLQRDSESRRVDDE